MKRILFLITAVLFTGAAYANVDSAYRFDAGEPTHEAVVQDYGSA